MRNARLPLTLFLPRSRFFVRCFFPAHAFLYAVPSPLCLVPLPASLAAAAGGGIRATQDLIQRIHSRSERSRQQSGSSNRETALLHPCHRHPRKPDPLAV